MCVERSILETKRGREGGERGRGDRGKGRGSPWSMQDRNRKKESDAGEQNSKKLVVANADWSNFLKERKK